MLSFLVGVAAIVVGDVNEEKEEVVLPVTSATIVQRPRSLIDLRCLPSRDNIS